ncbi:hypothetical protein KJ612_16855 [Myxococcota bacterium]|nr:hypothetical protein [Myxococcota bacterium]MBU1411880.1 hypothetical protein [Myxococcota bacterium]
MSSGLVVVKCTNCHQDTEIIPGTIVAECDHCGRLFRPTEGASAMPAPSYSAEAPPWERTHDVVAPWDNEKENLTPAHPFPVGDDGRGMSAADAQEADAAQAEVVRGEKKQRKARDKETRRREEEHHRETSGVSAPESFGYDDVEVEVDKAAPAGRNAPRRTPQGAPAPAASAAPAMIIFVALLLLAIGGYVLAKKDEGQSAKPKTVRERPERRPGRAVPPEEQPGAVTEPDGAEPVQPPTRNLTVSQRIGMEQVEKHSVILSADQLEKVKKVITHREKYPLHRWGAENPKVEVVVFAPFTHMGVARLKQLNSEFKKLDRFSSQIAVWFMFHWGPEQGLEAEAADIANSIQWTFKQEGMYHFVMLLQKEAIWRVAANNKFDEYIKEVGLDPAKLREQMKSIPLGEIRKEVSELMSDLHLQDKDLTFLIGGRSYLDGKTLYNVSKIVDYELSAREP